MHRKRNLYAYKNNRKNILQQKSVLGTVDSNMILLHDDQNKEKKRLLKSGGKIVIYVRGNSNFYMRKIENKWLRSDIS